MLGNQGSRVMSLFQVDIMPDIHGVPREAIALKYVFHGSFIVVHGVFLTRF